MMTNPSFEFRLKAGFIAVILILSLVVFLAFQNSRQFRAASASASQAQDTLLQIDAALIAMINAETGMRGFVLSGQEQFLEPYNQARAHIPTILKALPPDQSARLQPLIDQQFQFRQSVIDRIRSGQLSRDQVNLEQGKLGMDNIRRTVEEIRRAEGNALQERRRESETSDHRSLAALAALATVILLLLLGGFFLIRHYLAHRRRLEEERTRFFTLSHDLYGIANNQGFFIELNDAWERLLGYTRAELLAKPFIEFVHPDDRTATIAEAKKLAEGGRTVYFENRYLARDGSYKWLLWSAAPVQREGLIYAVARDISEHKKSEEKLAQFADEARRRSAELESLNQELEAFSYSVSHDLRAPLRHIAGFADMLQRHVDGKLDAKGQRFLNTIIESAKRMGMLIDDLLVFSRMGRTEMRSEPVDLNVMVDSVLNDLQPDIGRRRVVWKKDPLPIVKADKAMLRQVVVNLLSNAVKYTGPRDPAEIQISAAQPDGEFVITVADNGVGFDQAYAHKLFGVFQRLHEASEFEGTGIGLANVRRIISRHGGRVWAEGELDKGAAFHFSLPKR